MTSPVSKLGGLALNTVGEAIAFAAGVAVAPTLAPISTAIAQDAWSVAPIKAPEAEILAEGVAQGQVDPEKAHEWARAHGYSKEAFDALIDIANVGPAIGLAFSARRRNLLSESELRTALKRTGLEDQWYDAISALQHERLDMGAIATAIHRGIMRGEGLIVTSPPESAGRVPFPPQSDLDPVDEAAAHGIDRERLRVLVGNTGLPPGLMEMLRLLNMGKVTEDDVKRAVAESNLRNEYMDVALYLRRQLLTPHEYEEAALRGVITQEQAHAGAALHGMEHEDAKILFELLGRPLNVHQITTGLARGGTYGGSYDSVPQPFQDAIRRSNIRPEYAHLAYANRYTLPGAFVVRALAQGGDLTHEETHQLLLEEGWPPDLAATVSLRWTEGKKSPTDKHVTSAETGLFTVLRKAYVNDEATESEAGPILTDLGVPPADHARIFALWNHERNVTRLSLTPSQIKKAYRETKFTREEAIARLEHLGMTVADANTLLDE